MRRPRDPRNDAARHEAPRQHAASFGSQGGGNPGGKGAARALGGFDCGRRGGRGAGIVAGVGTNSIQAFPAPFAWLGAMQEVVSAGARCKRAHTNQQAPHPSLVCRGRCTVLRARPRGVGRRSTSEGVGGSVMRGGGAAGGGAGRMWGSWSCWSLACLDRRRRTNHLLTHTTLHPSPQAYTHPGPGSIEIDHNPPRFEWPRPTPTRPPPRRRRPRRMRPRWPTGCSRWSATGR